MADNTIQTSFAGGELSQALYARVDLAKFEVGAALLRNFIVDYRGGAINRPGTKYYDTLEEGTDAPFRLLPFIVSTEASYTLVFTTETIIVYRLGVLVTTVETPYAGADIPLLKYVQSADVMTIVHPSYPPANLNRTSDTTFTYEVIEVGPEVQPPTITEMRAPHSGPYNYGYLVTSVNLDGDEESLPSNIATKHSEGQDELNNRVVGFEWTAPATPVSRYNVFKWGPIDAVTMVPATAWGFIGTSQTTTFTDNNIAPDYAKQPPSWGDPFSGGQIESITVASGGSGYDGVAGDWPVIPYVPLEFTGDGTGAAGYAVIDHANGTIVGVFITNPGKNYTTLSATADGEGGTGATFTITLTNIEPLYPSCVSYLQQRRAFAGSDLKPATFVLSQPGLFENFNKSPVALPTDAIGGTISSQQVNTIKSLVPVSYGLLAFTTGGCYLIGSSEGPTGPISPETISVTQQASPGANDLIPQLVNYDVLFGQNKGNRILRAAFAWERQSFTTSDITQLAPHLFDNYSIVDWAYASEPNKLLWVVRSDGKLLSCTYVPEQDVYAWCRHDTQGLFKSVCVVPEEDTDAVYFIVERHVENDIGDPCWKTFFERLQDRGDCCIQDAWFLDSAAEIPREDLDITLYVTKTEDPDIVELWSYDPCLGEEGGGGGEEGATVYVMEAKENYGPEIMALYNDTSSGLTIATNDQSNFGQTYDHVRREIIYSVSVVLGEDPQENTTGWTLWSGDPALTISPAENYNVTEAKNKWITRRSIDTETINSFDCWSEDETVPAGIGGGDGTWRRFVSSTAGFGNTPSVIDPWTGDFWTHVIGSGIFVCCVYLFRREDDYVQIISPLTIDSAATGSHYEPIGVTEDWTYCYGELDDFINPGFENFLILTPREITAEETTQDRLLSYAEFALPSPLLENDANYRFCFNHSSQMFIFMTNKTGARSYVLYQFDEPTSAPYGGPVVGGGFTDITPWGPVNGPNTDIADYDLNSGSFTNNKLMAYFIPPATVLDPEILVCITKLLPGDTGLGVTDPALFRMDCTYVNLTSPGFNYHKAFVRGYMTAAWVPTEDPDEAAWAVQEVQELNLYLNQASYLFADIDYSKRWFWFQVQPVTGGVWTPSPADNHRMLVEYTFANGVAPVASRVIDEQGWDDAYPAYATEIGNTNVIDSSIDIAPDDGGANVAFVNGVYDPVTDSFWWPPDERFLKFDPAYADRYDPGILSAVLMKLSFDAAPIDLDDGDFVLIKCGKIEITETVGPGHYIGEIIEDISELLLPDDPNGVYAPIIDWEKTVPTQTVSGLSHLEGKEVWALADGVVIGPLTVTGGVADLGVVASTAVVGLKYTSQGKTLYLTTEGIQRGTEQGKRKMTQGATLRLDCTRGITVGTDFENLTTLEDTEGLTLFTGDAYAAINPDWNTKGEICFQQALPLPATVLGVIIGVVPGDTGR